MEPATEERPEQESLVNAIGAEIVTGAAIFFAPAVAATKMVVRSMARSGFPPVSAKTWLGRQQRRKPPVGGAKQG